jgi:hypothetical protein
MTLQGMVDSIRFLGISLSGYHNDVTINEPQELS